MVSKAISEHLISKKIPGEHSLIHPFNPLFQNPDNCIKLLAVAKPADLEFLWERLFGWQNSRLVTSLEGQLVKFLSTWRSDLFTHSYILSLQRRKPITCTFCAQGCPWKTLIAASRLVWTAVILNSSETSGPGDLKCTVRRWLSKHTSKFIDKSSPVSS